MSKNKVSKKEKKVSQETTVKEFEIKKDRPDFQKPSEEIKGSDEEPVKKEDPLFPDYPSLKNIKDYSNVIEEGEKVVIIPISEEDITKVGVVEGFKREENKHLFNISQIDILLRDLSKKGSNVVLYGKNTMHEGKVSFEVLDIMVSGIFMDFREVQHLIGYYNLPFIHVSNIIGYRNEDVDSISKGSIIRPMKERNHSSVGRVIFKV